MPTATRTPSALIPQPRPWLLAYMAYWGIRQNRIAEMLGVHPSHLHRMLRGERPLTLPAAKRLADALRCSLDFVMTGEGPEADLLPKGGEATQDEPWRPDAA